MNIVKKVVTVPTTKNNHFSSPNKISGVIKTSDGSATTFRTLVPSHCNWIKSMQVSEHCSFRTFATKNNNSCTSQYCAVSITTQGWCSTNLWLEPSWAIDVQHVSIVKINESSILAFIVMPSENDQWRSCKCSGVTSSWCWWYTFNLGECPKPLPFDWLSLAFRLLHIFLH